MKKIVLTLLGVIVLLICIMPISVYALGDVPIDEINFPDPIFREYVGNNFDLDRNGVFTAEEFAAVTKIDVKDMGIESMVGLEYFRKITELDCSGNELSELNVRRNNELERLNCGFNKITSLNLSQNLKLTYVYCSFNEITWLYVPECTVLESLYCSNNQLERLDIASLSALKALHCAENLLTELDLGNAPDLWNFNCYNNQLTVLDLTKLESLTWFDCHNNPLTALDLSQNPELSKLDCYKTKISVLDLRANPRLAELNCDSCQLTVLELSQNTRLEQVSFRGNQLSSLNLAECRALTSFRSDDNVYVFTGGRSFDVSALPGSFDVTKVSHLDGAVINGTVMTVDEGKTEISYTYDCGNGQSVVFRLHIHGSGRRAGGFSGYCGDKVNGEKVYYFCACGGRYYDEACTKPVEDSDDLVIPWAHTGGTATCQSGKLCDVCHQEYTGRDPLTHDFNIPRHHDESHWMGCVCGASNDVEAHTFDEMGVCACGYVTTVTAPSLSVGAVTAIVLISVIVVGIGGFAFVWFVIKKKSMSDLISVFHKK